LEALLAGKLPISRRSTLECCVTRNPANPSPVESNGTANCEQDFSSFVVNDCVITAGPPFKIIRMALRINGEPMVEVAGDGLIIATPGGSTAYNLSAGGPLLGPTVRAMVVTPLNPHSITHKPAVVDAASVLEVVAERVNAGTTCMLDGQIATPFREGDRIMIQLGANELLLARHPHVGEWQSLQDRLHWGRMPVLREVRGPRE
jgi:NAD+ kinase